MKVVVTSDFHGVLPKRGEIPPCDLLIIAGDFAGIETPGWLESLPAEKIVGVAGNHDFAARDDPGRFRRLPWVYLDDQGCEVGGFKVWGSPWSKQFGKWAFMAADDDLTPHWDLIPDDTDILITHGPAHLMLDRVTDGRHEGSVTLRERITRLGQLKLFCHGHIHEAYGVGAFPNNTGDGLDWRPIAVNASYMDVRYRPGNPPIVVNL